MGSSSGLDPAIHREALGLESAPEAKFAWSCTETVPARSKASKNYMSNQRLVTSL